MVIRSKALLVPLSAAAVLLALLLPVAPAGAAGVFLVNSTDDAVDASPGNGSCATAAGTCTLRAAVMEANAMAAADPSSPNSVIVPAGLYVLTGARGENGAATGDLDINGGMLTITGAGPGTVIDGGGVDRVFHLGAVTPARFTLMRVTVQNGAATTGSIVPGGPDIGGGVRLERNSSLVVESTTFQNNRADARGGAIGMPPTAGTVAGGTGTMTISNVTMRDNSAGVEGGAFFNNLVTRLTSVNIVNNQVTGVVGNERGGAIAQSGNLTLTGVFIHGNRLSSPSAPCSPVVCPSGGAIANRGDPTVSPQIFGTIRLDRVVMSANTAPRGAGIANGFNATASIANSVFSGNQASNSVGGLANQGPADLTNVVFSGNSSPAGGAIVTLGPPAGAPTARTTLRNVILRHGPDGTNCVLPPPAVFLAPVSLGNNISSDNSCNLTGPNDRNGVGL